MVRPRASSSGGGRKVFGRTSRGRTFFSDVPRTEIGRWDKDKGQQGRDERRYRRELNGHVKALAWRTLPNLGRVRISS